VDLKMNEIGGWILILVGAGLGTYMGVRFQSEKWLGGYSSLARRMVRLAHIACIALGMLNIQASQALARTTLRAGLSHLASGLFIAAAILMPLCCLWIAAGFRRFEIFAAPVICLATALVLTIGGLLP
jgi:hypothetical protein